MGGIVLGGSIAIGFMLVLGQRFYTDNVIMWLASSDALMILWRHVILAALLALSFVREYFDNFYLRAIWASMAIGLIVGGVEYGLRHGDFILDAMLMLAAGISFAIAALQPADEPLKIPAVFHKLSPARLFKHAERHLQYRQRPLYLRPLSEIRDDSHRLSLSTH